MDLRFSTRDAFGARGWHLSGFFTQSRCLRHMTLRSPTVMLSFILITYSRAWRLSKKNTRLFNWNGTSSCAWSWISRRKCQSRWTQFVHCPHVDWSARVDESPMLLSGIFLPWLFSRFHLHLCDDITDSERTVRAKPPDSFWWWRFSC